VVATKVGDEEVMVAAKAARSSCSHKEAAVVATRRRTR